MNNVVQSYSLPEELVAQLADHAQEEGLSKSLIVRWALEKFFASAKRKKRTKKNG